MIKKRLRKLHVTIKTFLTPLKSPPSSTNKFYIGPILEKYSTQRLRELKYQPFSYNKHTYDDLIPSDDEIARINGDRLEQQKLSQANDALVQAREALDLTLQSQHKLLVGTLITASVAVAVAIMSSSVALFVAFHTHPQTIYVAPNIVIKK